MPEGRIVFIIIELLKLNGTLIKGAGYNAQTNTFIFRVDNALPSDLENIIQSIINYFGNMYNKTYNLDIQVI